MSQINQLAELVGIQASYTDNSGNPVPTKDSSRDALLSAMGYNIEDTQQIELRIFDIITHGA